MNKTQNWAEALNISPKNLSLWSEQAPPEKPLLVWCLEQGHVHAQAYLEWASKAYSLPILSNDFFQDSFDRSQVAALDGDWNAWCFPVALWDGVTIVACVEPPSGQPASDFAYVLCDPQAMLAAWSGPDLGGGDAPSPSLDDAPIGVNLASTKTFRLELGDISIGDEKTAVDPNPIAHDSSEKTGMTLSMAIDPRSDTEINIARAKKTSAPQTAPPLPNEAAPPIPVLKAVPSDPPPILAEVSVAEAKPKLKAKSKAKSAGDNKKEAQAAFDKLKEDYQSAMLMRVTGTEAKPYLWDETLEIDPEVDQNKIDLNYPSLFRIVTKSQMPYHGYVIDSPVHREFFNSIHIPELPGCVTAVPLIVDGGIWGILIAFGGEGALGLEPLHFTEKIAENLVKQISDWAVSA